MAAIVDFTTLPQLFNNLVARNRGRSVAAVQFKDKKTKEWIPITWDELETRVQSLAGYLHSKGVRKGDRIAILSENRPEWIIIDLATHLLGAVNVSLYTSLPASQVEYIIKDSGSKLFFVSAKIQQRKAVEIFDNCPDLEHIVTMTDLEPDDPIYLSHFATAETEGATYWAAHSDELKRSSDAVSPDDIAALIYTSGTTGTPKGVMLTHANFSSNAKSALGLVPFHEGDHHLSFLPLCHSFERTAGYTAVLAAGGRISYAESVDTVSRNLLELSPTVMISVPRLFEKIYNAILKTAQEGSALKQRIFEWSVTSGKLYATKSRDGGTPGPLLTLRNTIAQRAVFNKLHDKLGGQLRFAVSGGAALPKEIGEFFEAAGVLLIEGYGLTETSPVISVNPQEKPRYGTVGHVIPGVRVGIQRLTDLKLVAEIDGSDPNSGLTSEEGEIITRGPHIMKGYWRNEEDTRQAIDADGWYHTGDVGRFVDGYLQITDRIKHMIVSKGGKNIYPGPIEDKLKSIPWIDQLLVVGEGREFLTALVVPDMEALSIWAKSNGVSSATRSGLVEEDAILKLFKDEFKSYSRKAASHEKIRDFRIIPEEFTVENKMLTPTLKPRRKEIEKIYADTIETMYT